MNAIHHAAPRALRSLALLALMGASLAACTPQDEAKIKEVGHSTAEVARENAATLGSKIDNGVDKARVAGAAAARAAGSALDDTAITAETKAALAKDTEISSGRVEVSTKDGRIELRGSVPTSAARGRASSIARSAKGASGVDNHLVVGSEPGESK